MDSQQGQPSASPERNPRRKVLAAIVAGIVVCGALIGYVLYTQSGASKSPSSTVIVAGDLVTMNYTGRLPDGKVFDTSIYSIAVNNATYPKSLTFSIRDASSYTPFNMTAGKYGIGGTIKGFALGVIGMQEGDHETIEVVPGDGYEVNANLTHWQMLHEEVPMTERLSTSEFSEAFETSPVPMAILPHYFWKWDVQVVEILAGTVLIKHIPTVGQVVYPFGNPDDSANPAGWPVKVLEYDEIEGMITVEHGLSPEDVYNVKGMDIDGKTIIVTAYNSDNGTFQVGKSDPSLGYNAEIAGRTLYFEVTIIKVTRAEAD